MSIASPLGRIQHHDEKSRGFAYSAAEVVSGKDVRHTMNAPNVDQFYTSGCVGFSGTNGLNCTAGINSRRVFNRMRNTHRISSGYLTNDDGLANYTGATQNDEFPGAFPAVDEGSSPLGLMKFWRKTGVITGYDWAFSFEAFLAALQSQPVLLGTTWYADMMNPRPSGIVDPTGKDVGGHEYLATELRWKPQVIGCQNSWGEGWGKRGMFYLRWTDLQRLLADGGDCVVPRFL